MSSRVSFLSPDQISDSAPTRLRWLWSLVDLGPIWARTFALVCALFFLWACAEAGAAVPDPASPPSSHDERRANSKSKPPTLPILPTESSPQVPLSLCDTGSGVKLEDHREQIQALADEIWKNMLRRPRYGDVGAGAIFTGNADWHSAVHAHWALLTMSRLMHDSDWEAKVLARLNDRDLERERAYLLKNPRYEFPYGQAWLLLLLTEMKKHAGAYTSVAASLEKETRARVLSWLETSDFPEYPRGGFEGAHDSWLFSFTLFQMSEPQGVDYLRLETIRKTKLWPQRDALRAKKKKASFDFIYLPAALSVAEQTVPPEFSVADSSGELDSGILSMSPPGHDSADEVVEADAPIYRDAVLPFEKIGMNNAHSPGAIMVSAWPHALQSRRGDIFSCRVFNQTLNEMFARRDQWQRTFPVSHWIPQFMWMGIWLEAGRP